MATILLYLESFDVLDCEAVITGAVRDIGGLRIAKVKIKKGVAKVSYAVDGIN